MKITEYIIDKENWGKKILFVTSESVLPTVRGGLFDRLRRYGVKINYLSFRRMKIDDIKTDIIFARDNYISDMYGLRPHQIFLHRNANDYLIRTKYDSDKIIIFDY